MGRRPRADRPPVRSQSAELLAIAIASISPVPVGRRLHFSIAEALFRAATVLPELSPLVAGKARAVKGVPRFHHFLVREAVAFDPMELADNHHAAGVGVEITACGGIVKPNMRNPVAPHWLRIRKSSREYGKDHAAALITPIGAVCVLECCRGSLLAARSVHLKTL